MQCFTSSTEQDQKYDECGDIMSAAVLRNYSLLRLPATTVSIQLLAGSVLRSFVILLASNLPPVNYREVTGEHATYRSLPGTHNTTYGLGVNQSINQYFISQLNRT